METAERNRPKRRRDSRGRFIDRLPGPGRPKGNKPRPKTLTERVADKAAERLQALTGEAIGVLEAQMRGDDPALAAQAARVILAKTTPDERHKGHRVVLPELAQAPTLTAKTQVIDVALAEGRITAEQAKTLIGTLKDMAEIADAEAAGQVLRLLRRGRSLAEAVALVDAMQPAALEQLNS